VDARLFVETEGPEDALIVVNVSVPLEYVNGSLHNQEMEVSMGYSEESVIQGFSKFGKIIQRILEAFPGAKVLTPYEIKTIHLQKNESHETLIGKNTPARGVARRATRRASRQATGKESYSMFDLPCFRREE